MRRKGLEYEKFRRQQPIGRYIADFVSFKKKIIIEVDGGQHAVDTAEKDRQRDLFFEKQGYVVLRFWNNEVLRNIEGVLEVIRQTVLKRTPSP